MKFLLKIFFIVLSLIILSRCNILDSDVSSISPLDSKINFKIMESYDNYESISKPEIFVKLLTEKIYSCFNYEIISYYEINNRTIEINIVGINKPSVCATALGPAKGSLKLGQLSGSYEIFIKGDGFVDNYFLLISDSLIILDGKETSNTKYLYSILYRYPKNSFEYLCYTTLADTEICYKFIDTLKTVINITEFDFSNFAVNPYLLSRPGYYDNISVQYFYYESEEDFKKIEEVMKSFKQIYFFNNNGVNLRILNWKNKNINSLLL